MHKIYCNFSFDNLKSLVIHSFASAIMSVRLRRHLATKVFQAFDNGQLNQTEVQNKITTWFTLKSQTLTQPTLQLSANHLRKLLKQGSTTELESKLISNKFQSELRDIATVSSQTNKITFALNPNVYVKDSLVSACDVNQYCLVNESMENIIVEYSSPNIAKPFHIGHLRSTIIGNYIANVLAAFGHNVIRINYLGDWGTQFGYLKLGMDMSNVSQEEFVKDPIKHLFQAYVKANKAGESDPSIAQKARAIFNRMEISESSYLDEWNRYREITVKEMETLYARLGVKFDIYSWESDYRKANILKELDSIEKLGFLQTEQDGKKSFIVCGDEKPVTLLKSDGSTLYLTRDIAAIIDRQKRFQFNRMYYVAGNEQNLHFQTLFKIVQLLGVQNTERLYHMKFGKVEKMSTRKGNVVFLSDILDEIREIMYEKQMKSEHTKINLDMDGKRTANILSVSALITFELERKATASYEFDMETIIKETSSSGKSFQITHARLCNLNVITGIRPALEANIEYLSEPEAMQLIFEIAKFPEVFYGIKQNLASSQLLSYMYSLNARTKSALKVLNIKNESNSERQAQRMLLFMTAKHILSTCMKLISITPLDRI